MPIPKAYICETCGVSGVKLWRIYQNFLEHQHLFCVDCAGKNQGEDVSAFDEQGFHVGPHSIQRTDTIGWLVPAVPTKDGTFWGYSSVPEGLVQMWREMPTRKA